MFCCHVGLQCALRELPHVWQFTGTGKSNGPPTRWAPRYTESMTSLVEYEPRHAVGASWVRLLAIAALLCVGLLASRASFAIDRILLEVDGVTAPGTQAAGASATLDLAHGAPVAHVRLGQVAVPDPIGPL